MPSHRPTVAARKEFAPTGTLRFGVVAAPEASPFFVKLDARERPQGVAVELAQALAERLGTPIEFAIAPNSGVLTDAVATGEMDAAFMPADEERKQRLAFGPPYFVAENTYLVRADVAIGAIADVDREGVRVVGISGTTTIRTAGRVLKRAQILAANSIDEAVALLAASGAEAFALSRDSLPRLAARLPGSRVLDGAFHRVGVALALRQNLAAAAEFAAAFMNEAKASGLVRRALDAAGFPELPVAP